MFCSGQSGLSVEVDCLRQLVRIGKIKFHMVKLGDVEIPKTLGWHRGQVEC